MSPPHRLSEALAVLREREFRLFYAGQTVSVIGDAMLLIALSFAVLDLTGSVTDVGLVIAASRAPLVLTVIAGGVVADRVSRRRLMVVADLVRMVALGVTAVLLVSGDATLWELIALQAASGVAAGFFYPALTGLLPLTVSAEHLQPANALRALSDSTAKIAGPAVAGILVVAAGPGWALGVDAATFGVSAVSLALLHLPAHVPPVPQRFVHDLAEGWREFWSRTWVWVIVIFLGSIGNLFTAAATVVGPQISNEHYGGAGVWAAAMSAQGVGGLLAGVVVLGLRPQRPLVACCLAFGLVALPNLLLAFIVPGWVLIVSWLVGGAGMASGQVLWDTTLQRNIPAASLSRVSSYDWFGSLVFNPVGLALAGPVSAAIGTEATLLLAAGWLGGSTIVLASLPSVRAVRGG